MVENLLCEVCRSTQSATLSQRRTLDPLKGFLCPGGRTICESFIYTLFVQFLNYWWNVHSFIQSSVKFFMKSFQNLLNFSLFKHSQKIHALSKTMQCFFDQIMSNRNAISKLFHIPRIPFWYKYSKLSWKKGSLVSKIHLKNF